MERNTISLSQYIGKLNGKGSFIIPQYQRGYVWGQYNKNREGKLIKDSVSYLIDSILHGYADQKDIFLQGITVCEDNVTNDITLVDGQQRTTFFYLLLKYLGFTKHIAIHYLIRKESDDFLKEIDFSNCERNDDEPFQDVYFFKKTMRIFSRMLYEIDRASLLNYVLEHVRFLYIPIPPEKATIIFSLMNGNKAEMKQEELIKSELLRRSSINSEYIKEAENSSIRNRLAREWDKWLYWWNDENVKGFFGTNIQLGWLLPLIENTVDVSFEDFRGKCFKEENVKEAKAIFRRMRLLQKRIEDSYENAISYNYIGTILKIRNKEQVFMFLKWYFVDVLPEDNHDIAICKLRKYFDWAILGVAHTDIIRNDRTKYNEKRDDFLDRLKDDLLYKNNYEIGAKWLLRCNILEDCSQNNHNGRKFNFDIWTQRSLEHIFPKSLVGHYQNNVPCDCDDNPLDDDAVKKKQLWREDIYFEDTNKNRHEASEHSIGNLVLLYKNDNSKFNASDFEQKKNLYFQITDEFGFQSRHLLHTVSIFANSKWEGEDIAKHKKQEIDRFITEYPEYNE